MEKKKIFHNQSIRRTIFIYFTITALAASLLITFSIYGRLSSQVSQTVMEENQSLISQVARSVESYLRTVMKLSDSLYYGAVKNADLSSESINSEITLLYDNNRDDVANIALFSQDGALIEAVPAARIKTNLDVKSDSWFTNALDKTENQHFSDPHVQTIFDGNESQYQWVISLSRAVELTEGTSTAQGVLLVDLSYSSLAHLFNGVTTGSGGYVYLISSDGEIFYHPKMQLIDSGRFMENNLAAAEYKDGNHLEEFEGTERIVTVKSVGYTGWKVVGVTPKNVVSLNTIKTRLFIIFIITLILFILTFINSYISSRITDPIKELEKSVGILEEGNLQTPVYIGGSYEIQHLGTSISNMAKQIRVLMNDIVTEHEAKRKQEFDTLQSQINPHFLYNTLESINWRAKASKNAEISMMAESLGTLLRSTLSNHESLVELDYELELVRAYITIQKIRFEDRLDFVSLVADDLHHILMPPLTIQPLIENAIRYGMEEMTETCHVELLVRHEDDKVLIRVKNNGSVFEEDLLEKLKRREKQPNGFGIGLMNIDQRIRLLFGDACGLELKNEDDCATANIHIPFQVKENQSYAETDHCRR